MEFHGTLHAIYYGLTSLLHAAADLGSLEAVDLLLEYGADPDGIPDPDTPVPALLIETSKGHVDIVRRLLEAGVIAPLRS